MKDGFCSQSDFAAVSVWRLVLLGKNRVHAPAPWGAGDREKIYFIAMYGGGGVRAEHMRL